MIMDGKNSNFQGEKVISCKWNCSIVARMVKGAQQLQKQLELVANDNQLHVDANELVAFWGIYFNVSFIYNQYKSNIITILIVYGTLMKHGFKLGDSLE